MVNPARGSLERGCHCWPQRRNTVVGISNSAKGPISRILFYAVIPLGAASPRTLISDLPGSFGNCSSRLGASGRYAMRVQLFTRISLPIWSCSVWGLPCLRPYGRSGALLPHLFTLTLRICLAANPRGGIFSVALAVYEFLRSHPGRYPAHCPAEFGLSSPGNPVAQVPAATARSSCQFPVYPSPGVSRFHRAAHNISHRMFRCRNLL
jgi:hypothetical protein